MLVVGDFNARRNSRSLRLFYEAGFARSEQQGTTFHFNTGTHLFGAIDHILHDSGAAPVAPAVTERRKVDGLWPSDHYPVWTDFRLVHLGASASNASRSSRAFTIFRFPSASRGQSSSGRSR